MAIITSGCQVHSRQREIRGVMIEGTSSVACRVAGKTGRAVVRISVYANVLIVRFRVLMAGYAGKFCEIRRIGMAIGTLIPFTFVRAAVYREVRRIVIGI